MRIPPPTTQLPPTPSPGAATARVATPNPASPIRDSARQLVASAFIAPLFAQLRDSPFKADRFTGGQAEDAFGAQLDQILADRFVQRLDTPAQPFALVESIADKFAAFTPNQPQATPTVNVHA